MSFETILVSIGALIIGGGIGFLVKFLLDKSLIASAKKDREEVLKKIDEAVQIEKTEQQKERDSWSMERLQLQKDKVDALDSLKNMQEEMTKVKAQLEDAKAGFESSLAALKLTNIYDQINVNIRAKLDQLDRSLSSDGTASPLTISLIEQIIQDINTKNLSYGKTSAKTGAKKVKK